MDHEDSEIDLIERSIRGDNSAFEKLITVYKNIWYGFACKVLGDKSLAQDVVQDTCIKIYKNLSTLKERDIFGRWSFAILLNTIRDSYRKRKTLTYVENIEYLNDFHFYESSTLTDLINKELILEVFSRMPCHERETLLLHFYEDLNSVDISKKEDCKPATARRRKKKAMDTFREIFLRIFGEDDNEQG